MLLPIEYCTDKTKVFPNLYKDLELLESPQKSMYEYILNPTTVLGKNILKRISQYTTTNIPFLKESQQFYDSLNDDYLDKECLEDMWKCWKEIKNQEGFFEKYQYIDWDRMKWLNANRSFLSFLSFYNLASPILNLILPIIMLLIPFVLLKIMKIPLTFQTYKTVLLQQLKNHAIGRLFTDFGTVTWDKRFYILLSLGIYFFNIYQNVISCYRFYININTINRYFTTLKKYTKYTLQKIDSTVAKTKNLASFTSFRNDIQTLKSDLISMITALPAISNISFKGLLNLGSTMKEFYQLYNNKTIDSLIQKTFVFNGYLDIAIGIHNNKHITNAQFRKSKTPYLVLSKTFCPTLIDKNPVKNSITLKKNIIITGPNAAGKTTMLKTVIVNILCTQQFGKGFYKKAIITPFDYIHCYLNIPDTMARDSLFQAEARRCKNILKFIKKNPQKKHFCIFDELYSGTNPYEAISSAYAYLTFISKNPHVRFMLTTHFIKLCNLYKKNTSPIVNYHMQVTKNKNKLCYPYKIKKGISKIKGGIAVLKELNYPREILFTTQKILKNL